jgi:hypothetical protein
MSMAEIFLLVWAGVATTLAVLYRNGSKNHRAEYKAVAILLAEVSLGEVKPKDEGDGFVSVENEDLRLTFKKIRE